jgi:surface protein
MWFVTKGDVLIRCPDDISCFFGRCEIPGEIFPFFGLSHYFDQGSFFRLLFLRVDCECNRPSFLATVFENNRVFNGDLNQWDVSKVTTMSSSKSILVYWRMT